MSYLLCPLTGLTNRGSWWPQTFYLRPSFRERKVLPNTPLLLRACPKVKSVFKKSPLDPSPAHCHTDFKVNKLSVWVKMFGVFGQTCWSLLRFILKVTAVKLYQETIKDLKKSKCAYTTVLSSNLQANILRDIFVFALWPRRASVLYVKAPALQPVETFHRAACRVNRVGWDTSR